MSLLTVVKDVCAAVGVEIPAAVIPGINANRTMQEMLAVANEMAQRIAYNTREWQALRARAFLVGDGIKDSFPLPVNYKSLLLTSNLWRTTGAPGVPTSQIPLRFVPDHDEWTRRRAGGFSDSRGEWIISSNAIFIVPILPVGQQVEFFYLDKNCVNLASGGVGDTFMSDNDTFRLDERLLKLGMIWSWKQLKGSPYAEDMSNYQDALSYASGKDLPAPIIIGRMPMSSSMTTSPSYPFPV